MFNWSRLRGGWSCNALEVWQARLITCVPISELCSCIFVLCNCKSEWGGTWNVMAGLFLIFFCPFLSLCSWSLCHKLNRDLYEKLQYIQIQHFLLQNKIIFIHLPKLFVAFCAARSSPLMILASLVGPTLDPLLLQVTLNLDWWTYSKRRLFFGLCIVLTSTPELPVLRDKSRDLLWKELSTMDQSNVCLQADWFCCKPYAQKETCMTLMERD